MKIEAGVPIPPENRGRKESETTRAAADMEVGQSVLCMDRRSFETLRAALRRRARKFTTRKVPGEGWRIWRIE